MKNVVIGVIVLGTASFGCKDGTDRSPAPQPSAPIVMKNVEEPAHDPAPKDVQVKPRPGTNPSRINQLYDLKTTTITIGPHKFKAWIMDDNSKRTEGMMFLTNAEFKDNETMLFVFPDEVERSFWMHNTLVDLDIAYIKKDGTLVSVHTMKALDETGVPSKGAAMYALEARAGLFKRLGIRAGMKAIFSQKFNPQP